MTVFPNLNFVPKATSAMFVSIDTIAIDGNKNGAAGMMELLVSELGKADDNDWKIVLDTSRHPCHSGGHYGGFSSIQEQVLDIIRHHPLPTASSWPRSCPS